MRNSLAIQIALNDSHWAYNFCLPFKFTGLNQFKCTVKDYILKHLPAAQESTFLNQSFQVVNARGCLSSFQLLMKAMFSHVMYMQH